MVSLRNICLNLIIEKIEKFNFAFCVSNDDKLKHNFEFLQRTSSFELASELHKRGKLKPEYMKLVMNEHLTILDGRWITKFLDDSFENALEAIFSRLQNLQVISFRKICNDKILINVTKFCPRVTEIDARDSNITDKGIMYLCRDENGKIPCPKLQKLLMGKSFVTEEGVKYVIQNLPSLHMIDYQKVPNILYSLYVESLSAISSTRSYNLVDLDLLKMQDIPDYYTDLLKVCFSVCPGLKSMACFIYDKEQLHLIKNGMEKLNLKFCKKGRNMNINNFLKTKGSNLTSLIVYNCTMSVSDLCASCPKVKELCVSNVTFTDHDNSYSQTSFGCLIDCSFKYTKDDTSTNKAIGSLLSSKKIESVSFYSCNLSADVKTHILKCCENCLIKVIGFECLVLEESFVKDVLLNCPTLMTLKIQRCYSPGINRTGLITFAGTLLNKPHIYFNDLERRLF